MKKILLIFTVLFFISCNKKEKVEVKQLKSKAKKEMNKKLILKIDAKGWEMAQIEDINKVLISSSNLLRDNIDTKRINNNFIVIRNSKYNKPKPTDYPQIFIYPKYSDVFLSVENRLWAKFAYQFSHEYCHHLVNQQLIKPNFDQFGWFEETLCELSSLHSLKYMSKEWKKKPPYPNWHSYSESLDDYANEIIKRKSNKIEISLSKWIKNNLNELSKDRYLREKNTLIATHLLPLFTKNPYLWNSITYIKDIKIDKNITFKEYINKWELLLPKGQKNEFQKLKLKLLN